MNRIIGNLFLGSIQEAHNLELLQENGITHLINLSGIKNPHEGHFTHLDINILDDPSEDISRHFNRCNRFIYNALFKGGKVLVYCYAGACRGPSIVAAYLIRKSKQTTDQAIQYIRDRRTTVDINDGFTQQLYDYHTQTHT
jgi:protein-tyrosine phosphatase